MYALHEDEMEMFDSKQPYGKFVSVPLPTVSLGSVVLPLP